MSRFPCTTPHLLISGPTGFSILIYDRDMAKLVASNVANNLHHLSCYCCVFLV